MKWNTIIILVLGLIVIGAGALALLHLSSEQPTSGSNVGASPSPAPQAARADVLEKFAALRDQISAAGQSYGGAAVQLINGEETAMVYIYRPVGNSDISGPLAAGFKALYATFDAKDPLLVGLVDTTQKISAQQYKVDIYALERSVVADYLNGNITTGELPTRALFITPESSSLHPDGSASVRKSIDLNYVRPANYVAPTNRTFAFSESINESGYSGPASLQAGQLTDGTKAISVVMGLKNGASSGDKYAEIEAILKACAVGYGDYDRYMISLLPSQEGVYDYYYIDASAPPVLAFLNGNLDEGHLFRDINMTYYTK